MKCAKCKKEMKRISVTSFAILVFPIEGSRLVCANEKCEYYGIPRIDLRKETEDEDEK